jgi:lysophospholipid acyltransferase (LPLAT)-like uncharacterized protein
MKRLLAWLSSTIIHFVGATLRITVEDRGRILDQPEHPPVIIAFWHNRTALMAYFYEHYCRGRTALTFISRSRDGQFMTDVAAHFGIKAVRGSSSRHGISAALTAIRASNDEKIDLVITPDGPRGPRYEIQPGLIRLAQATGRPIVAVTYRLKWKLELKSWDRFHVPMPFSVCHLVTGERIFVPEEAPEEELACIARHLKSTLGADES